MAVDQCKAVEDEHERGCEAIMPLYEHGETEQAACDHGHAEVEQASAHRAVEMEGVLLPLYFEERKEADRAKRDQKKQ